MSEAWAKRAASASAQLSSLATSQHQPPSAAQTEREEQPIADRVAQNLEIIFKNFQFSTRRTRILMGFIITTIY